MNTQYCFLSATKFPSESELQKAITSSGYSLKLDPKLDLENDEGFSPCTLDEYDEPGFEIESGTVSEIFEDDESFERHLDHRSRYISMSWGGRFEDCLCVMIVTLVLMRGFDAVVTYDCEEPDSIQEIEAGIEECLRELKKT